MHDAIAWYYENWELDPDALITNACEVYEREIDARKDEYARTDELEKGLVRGPLLLQEWHNTWYKYDREHYKIAEIENERVVPIGPDGEFILTVRPDRVLENRETGMMVIPDVKTSGYSPDAPFKQADAQDQMTSYIWALTRMEPDWTIEGAFIDVLFVRESRSQDPEKLFTQPKAIRPGFIYRDKEALDQFELGLFGTILEVSQKYENIEDFHPEMLFPRCGKNCSMYSCEYVDICRKHLEPGDLPDGFSRDPWLEACEPQKLKE